MRDLERADKITITRGLKTGYADFGPSTYRSHCMSFPVLTFTEGSDQVRVQCYLHTSQYRPQGWYEKAERVLTLSKPFRMA